MHSGVVSSEGGRHDALCHHNFLVITPMIMKLGRGMKLNVLVTKNVMSLLLCKFDVITCILADA